MCLRTLACKIFVSALESVKPEKLIANAVQRDGDLLCVNGKKYLMKKNVFVVGFGKAVYGMAVGLQEVLSDHIVGGYLSVPHGLNLPSNSKCLNNTSKIDVVQAAQNNLPDTAALNNAIHIKKIVDSLTSDDIAIILISGGGSALLPLPVSHISLEEKLECIKVVANAGGNIQQLNTIRKKLSQIKGGGLLSSCSSKQVLSLIISDIVDDPLDLIASGPTVTDTSTVHDCLEILSNLNILKKVPPNVLEYLKSNDLDAFHNSKFVNENQCDNVVVGSNRILVDSVCKTAKENGYLPLTITKTLEGDAEQIGIQLAEITSLLLGCHHDREKIVTSLSQLNRNILAGNEFDVDECIRAEKICLITAGETTVNVKGSGTGGRNQHLILAAMNHIRKTSLENSNINLNQMCLLSAGTDGQDGPTDAAGALCDGRAISEAMDLDLDLKGYLENCGSYDFFNSYPSLDCLLKTGLTGTNVMDVQVVLIDKGVH